MSELLRKLVLRMHADGDTDEQISQRLKLSEQEIKEILKSITDREAKEHGHDRPVRPL